MLMILSLSVVYAAPPGLWPLSDYGLHRDYGPLPDYGLHRDYAPFRSLASSGVWPLPEYGLHRDKAKSSPCK